MTSPLIRVEEEMVNVRKEAAAMAAGILDIDDEKLRSPSGFLLMEGMASGAWQSLGDDQAAMARAGT